MPVKHVSCALPPMIPTLYRRLVPCLLAGLLVSCAASAPPGAPADNAGVDYSWSKAELRQKLQAGVINAAQARRTLRADGDFCAAQANRNTQLEIGCRAGVVFECVPSQTATLSACSSMVRGPECRPEQQARARGALQPAFNQCMNDIGWTRSRVDG